MVAMSHQGRNESARSQSRDTYKETDKTPLASDQLRKFQPGECIVVSRSAWWHGQSYELHAVRDNLPAMGAESPATPRIEGNDDDDNHEDHDSWLSLARSKVGELTDDSDEDTDDVDDTNYNEDIDDTDDDEIETEPEVWAANTDSTLAQTFTESGWEQTLDRLDVQNPPITDKQNVDAIRDIAGMLDDRVLMLPNRIVVTEIRELLADIVAQTGLSETQTLDIVTDRTDILRVNDQFEESFTKGASESSPPAGGIADNPFNQNAGETNTASMPESTTAEQGDSDQDPATAGSGAESVTDDSAQSDTAPDTQIDDQQYTLDGIEEKLPAESDAVSQSTDDSAETVSNQSANDESTSSEATSTSSAEDDESGRSPAEFM